MVVEYYEYRNSRVASLLSGLWSVGLLVRLWAVSCVLCVCNIDGLLDNTLMDYKIIGQGSTTTTLRKYKKNHFYQLNMYKYSTEPIANWYLE